MDFTLRDWTSLALKKFNRRFQNVGKLFPPEIKKYTGHVSASCICSTTYYHAGCMLFYMYKQKHKSALQSCILTRNIENLYYLFNNVPREDIALDGNLTTLIIKNDLINFLIYLKDIYKFRSIQELLRYKYSSPIPVMHNIFIYDACKIYMTIYYKPEYVQEIGYAIEQCIQYNATLIFNKLILLESEASILPILQNVITTTACLPHDTTQTLCIEILLKENIEIRNIHVSNTLRVFGYGPGLKVLYKFFKQPISHKSIYSITTSFYRHMTFIKYKKVIPNIIDIIAEHNDSDRRKYSTALYNMVLESSRKFSAKGTVSLLTIICSRLRDYININSSIVNLFIYYDMDPLLFQFTVKNFDTHWLDENAIRGIYRRAFGYFEFLITSGTITISKETIQSYIKEYNTTSSYMLEFIDKHILNV